jgi:hypothetical protein
MFEIVIAFVGVPEILPLEVLNESPASVIPVDPDASEYVYVAAPPERVGVIVVIGTKAVALTNEDGPLSVKAAATVRTASVEVAVVVFPLSELVTTTEYVPESPVETVAIE